jgi:hypothetical protein
LGDPHDRLKVVCAFDSDLARARGTVLRPPSAVSSFGGFRTPAPVCAATPSWGRHPKPFTEAEVRRARLLGLSYLPKSDSPFYGSFFHYP